MKKNYLHVVLWLVLLVVITLLAMNKLPQLSILGSPLKEVDILADIKAPQSDADPEDAALAEIIDRRADSIIAAKKPLQKSPPTQRETMPQPRLKINAEKRHRQELTPRCKVALAMLLSKTSALAKATAWNRSTRPSTA